MKCPVCGNLQTVVSNVRKITTKAPSDKVMRRRICHECSFRFTTYEMEISVVEEMFERRIKNPEILEAIMQILKLEMPYVRTYREGR
jgi:C4-type Zn-finger protein